MARSNVLARSGGRAVAAGAVEDDVVALDRVAGSPPQQAERALELRVGERLDLPAVVADEVMVVLPAGERRLESRAVSSELDPLEVPVARELLERAVDARDADPSAALAEPVEDLLRGEAARLLAEELDHGATGPTVPVARPAERGEGGLGPGARRRGSMHALNDSASQNQ